MQLKAQESNCKKRSCGGCQPGGHGRGEVNLKQVEAEVWDVQERGIAKHKSRSCMVGALPNEEDEEPGVSQRSQGHHVRIQVRHPGQS